MGNRFQSRRESATLNISPRPANRFRTGLFREGKSMMTVEPIPKKQRKWKRWVVAAAVVLVVAGLGLWWAARSRFQADAMPNPNGFDDFVAAAKQIDGELPKGSAADVPSDALRAFTSKNHDAFERARRGLERESRVTLPAGADLQALLDRSGTLRRLARLFQARAVLAERDGRSLDAALGFRDEIRLGRALIPGGLITDRLVGRVYEEQGAEGLAPGRRALGRRCQAPGARGRSVGNRR